MQRAAKAGTEHLCLAAAAQPGGSLLPFRNAPGSLALQISLGCANSRTIPWPRAELTSPAAERGQAQGIHPAEARHSSRASLQLQAAVLAAVQG